MGSGFWLHRTSARRSEARSRSSFTDIFVRFRSWRGLLFHPGIEHGRGDRGISRAHRQGTNLTQVGLWLLAEPPALRNAGAVARSSARISQTRSSARQYRSGLAVLAARQMGLSVFRSGTLP